MTAVDIPVAARLAESIERHAERPALVTRSETVTYAELGRRCAGVLRRLERLGLGSAPRLGIVTGDDVGTCVAVLAALLNGSAYVPVSRKSPPARNLEILRDADVAGLLAAEPTDLADLVGVPLVLDLSAGTDTVDTPGLASFARSLASPARALAAVTPAADDDAYLLFTSGSTGKPKGVPITHASLNRFMAMMLDEAGYEFSPSDRCLQMFDLTFDLSVVSLFLPLCVGASCHVVADSRVGFVATLKVLQEQRITVALMVPSLLAYAEPYLDSLQLPDLRLSMFCGEALQERLVEQWAQVVGHRPIHNWYGPTEATIFCLRYEWRADRSPPAAVNGIVPIGRPLGDTSAWLVDGDGRPIESAGTRGELILAGRQLTAGYWRAPERTAQAFLPAGAGRARGYRTGDICFLNDDGDFVYCGRADEQVKIDGHRVELGEIEHAVRTITQRSAVAAVAAEGPRGTTLVLFLEQPEADFAALTTALTELLPAHMIPRRVLHLDRLPLNANGKLDRPKLRALV